jgi:hypothetical protein
MNRQRSVQTGPRMSRDATCHALIVQTAIFVRVRGTASAVRACGRARSCPLLAFGRHRRDVSVGRVGDQPRPAVQRVEILEPVHGVVNAGCAAERRGPFNRLFGAVLSELVELGLGD